MNGIWKRLAAIVFFLALLASCKKRSETVRSDLGEAGYKLTTEDWFRASRANDVPALKKFISGKFLADTRNAEGDSALHAAAAAGALGAADFLLNQGLAVDLRGAAERTPLMAAVLGEQTEMVRWLLRQGADPGLKDQEGFKPLMLAVREGRPAAVAELAAHTREDLDSALLLAALVGRADVIDALTNFGASIYARMEDGRTPLMIAAENGHVDAVKLLVDIGANRFSTDPDGRTAADIATASGHLEIAELISREPLPADLALESPVEIGKSMDAMDVRTAVGSAPRAASKPIAGETLSAAVASEQSRKSPAARPATGEVFPMPPLVMRHYREKQVPVNVKSVVGDTATVRIRGLVSREVTVRTGEPIPGSNLVVVRVQRRMEDSKLSLGQPTEISVVEVRDRSTGSTREWISGVPSQAHDPVALVEDAATGQRYLASPGQRFKGADGAEYLISDVRPNQIVIQETASGAVQTIPLRGPRG